MLYGSVIKQEDIICGLWPYMYHRLLQLCTMSNWMAQPQADNKIYTTTNYLPYLWNEVFVEGHTCTVESRSCAP